MLAFTTFRSCAGGAGSCGKLGPDSWAESKAVQWFAMQTILPATAAKTRIVGGRTTKAKHHTTKHSGAPLCQTITPVTLHLQNCFLGILMVNNLRVVALRSLRSGVIAKENGRELLAERDRRASLQARGSQLSPSLCAARLRCAFPLGLTLR